MYEVSVDRTFSAAHCLRDYDGPCARLHGHNYKVQITVAGEATDANGMLLDFTRLKAICDEVLGALDHQYLNDLPAFADKSVTAENLAAEIHRGVAERLNLPGVRLARVRLWESEGSSVSYSEG